MLAISGYWWYVCVSSIPYPITPAILKFNLRGLHLEENDVRYYHRLLNPKRKRVPTEGVPKQGTGDAGVAKIGRKSGVRTVR